MPGQHMDPWGPDEIIDFEKLNDPIRACQYLFNVVSQLQAEVELLRDRTPALLFPSIVTGYWNGSACITECEPGETRHCIRELSHDLSTLGGGRGSEDDAYAVEVNFATCVPIGTIVPTMFWKYDGGPKYKFFYCCSTPDFRSSSTSSGAQPSSGASGFAPPGCVEMLRDVELIFNQSTCSVALCKIFRDVRDC